MMSTAAETSDGVIDTLHDALSNKATLHEPWTSGLVTLPESAKTLFYIMKDGSSRPLKLDSITEEQAEELSDACLPATFGLNNQDVLDETYRKAGKLDADKFSWNFNPSDYGDFSKKLTSGLFPWNSLDKGIRFELYKLNVYGRGSFFKAHQDTPRDENMFGSLVIVLPFDHTGGNLLLKHRDRDFHFDGQALLQDAHTTSVAYVAFFSDVEHEVTEVTSGHRVTITYNLYFDPNKGAPIIEPSMQLEHPFLTKLKNLKEDANLRSAHPILGFGLQHAYPFKTAILQPESLNLKGIDATLIKILNDLGIAHRFFLLYRENEKNSKSPFRILSNNIVHGYDNYGEEEDAFRRITNAGESWLVWNKPEASDGAEENWAKKDRYGYFHGWYGSWTYAKEKVPNLNVEWVTKPSEEHVENSISLAYGNEPSLGFHYHQLCVVATFGDDFRAKEETERRRRRRM